jgi:tetratricopeptide (TPR) repeat protein
MKNAKWLDVTEYALLVSSGVGAVAAIATQQIALTATPLSLLMAINLINRRRFDRETQTTAATNLAQLDRRLSQATTQLKHQIIGLPTWVDLDQLHQGIQADQAREIANIQQQLLPLETVNLTQVQEEINQLGEQYRALNGKYGALTQSVGSMEVNFQQVATVSQVKAHDVKLFDLKQEMQSLRQALDELPRPQKVSGARALQDQIDHLNRRVNRLPQPFDGEGLKQDLDGMLKLMGDLVSRRELAKMMAEVEKVRHQNQTIEQFIAPIRTMNTILRKQMDTLSIWVRQRQENQPSETMQRIAARDLDSLRAVIETLEERMQQLPVEMGDDFTHFTADMHIIMQQMSELQAQIAIVEQKTQGVEAQQQNLEDRVNRLPTLLDHNMLHDQIEYLTMRMALTEGNLTDVRDRLMATVKSQLAAAPTTASSSPSRTPSAAIDYELILDLKSTPDAARSTAPTPSGELVTAALEAAQSRVMVVFPYPDQAILTPDVIQAFQAFLNRGGHLDIGWGLVEPLQSPQQPRYLHQNQGKLNSLPSELQKLLGQLADLKRAYPHQFHFKVLGTIENFLICDDQYAVLGIQAIATANTVFPHVSVGLRTRQQEVIQRLKQRFEDPQLDRHDPDSYFNRALTRYELGDKAGAIADYTEVLSIDSGHAVAYNNRALVHYEMGNPDPALADFEQALLANSAEPMVYCNRGIVRAEADNPLGAIEDFSTAIQIDANCWPAYWQRAIAHNRMGHKTDAIADFTEVLRINPEHAVACFYRGLARIKVNDHIGAIRDLKQAAGLFSAQGNHIGHQQVKDTMHKLRQHLVVTGHEKRA